MTPKEKTYVLLTALEKAKLLILGDPAPKGLALVCACGGPLDCLGDHVNGIPLLRGWLHNDAPASLIWKSNMHPGPEMTAACLQFERECKNYF